MLTCFKPSSQCYPVPLHHSTPLFHPTQLPPLLFLSPQTTSVNQQLYPFPIMYPHLVNTQYSSHAHTPVSVTTPVTTPKTSLNIEPSTPASSSHVSPSPSSFHISSSELSPHALKIHPRNSHSMQTRA